MRYAFSVLPNGATFLALTATIAIGSATSPNASLAQTAPKTMAEWTTPGGTDQGTRYSGLKDITADNAATLVEEFSFSTTTRNSHQGSPLVVGTGDKATMYVVTPFPNKLIAVNLKDRSSWTYSPNPRSFATGLTCCDVVNRGAAYGVIDNGGPNNGKGVVVYTLLDGNVVAVDTATHAQLWRTKVADPWKGETLNTPTIVIPVDSFKNTAISNYPITKVVVFGSSGSEMGVRGSVRALDLATGKLVWQAYGTGPDKDVKIDSSTVAPFDKDRNSVNGADQGVTSWPTSGAATWQHGGATSWAWVTYDPDTKTLFYGTSQPGTFNPEMRMGGKTNDNKWGASIFARDPRTGVAKWVYQLVPWDNWDYDTVNESTVVDLNVDGSQKKVIVHFSKNGIAYVMDRVTGKLLSAKAYGDLNWAKPVDSDGNYVDLHTGLPTVNPDKQTIGGSNNKKAGDITDYICPSAFGVKDWEYSAFSPDTNLFYFGAHNMCMSYEPLQVNYIAGTPFVGVSIGITPHKDANGAYEVNKMGEFVAFNPVTGLRAWTIPEAKPVFGGALVTAGKVVFYGTLDKHFRAVNAETGGIIKSWDLECGVTSAPITFLGADGKQRVAITTGLGYLNGGFAGGKCPASDSSTSGMVHVYKLQ
ncbi:PQQ-binding-like beta-propeller repeat protein [Methylocystis echinoides]|nr:PQQ-binding-like beta-propeller repeat protein [Methylocystis echinoides]